MASLKDILAKCLTVGVPDELPPMPEPRRTPTIPHAPKRVPNLSKADRAQALANALRYFPTKHHAVLAKEFAEELDEFGHIYMYRFRPTEYVVKAHSIDSYPAKNQQAAALMLMIMNVLHTDVAMFPEELITYGGNGSVFSNWIQYQLTMQYLSNMTTDQTLPLNSGHPTGLFPSHGDAPRCVISNGLMVPNYSTREQYERLYAMGCTQYGQMTAGSFCYIGSQGIVHGTTITIRNAGRKYLNTEDMRGKVFVTAGLGGMSGAQPKAGVICGTVTVVAEVDRAALEKRLKQGWLLEVADDVEDCVKRLKRAREDKIPTSIGYHGNVVTLWERLAEEPEHLVDLGSDQTSLHNPFGGGYYPVQLSFEEGNRCLAEDPARFKELVQETLRRHCVAVNKLADRGMRFWDYGNSFLLEASRAGAAVGLENNTSGAINQFRYPSYVQDIMGDVFSLGFGPFRWVCSSGEESDLRKTDELAAAVIEKVMADSSPESAAQFRDNLVWIRAAMENKMVVGSQARILYADCVGRQAIADAFNCAVASGELKGPVVLSRDHHDVSGTDSPFRETSDVYDGSAICADMSIQNVIGDAFRGATWVAIHNGGGVGWGEVMNGGFGMVLDGTPDAARRASQMLQWDVLNGVCRRGWAGNQNGKNTIIRAMAQNPNLRVTVPNEVDRKTLEGL